MAISDDDKRRARVVLERCGGNRARASAQLGVSAAQLDRIMREMGVRSRDFAGCAGSHAPTSLDRDLIALRDENADLRRRLKAAVREDLDAEKVREAIFGLSKLPAVPPRWINDGKPSGSAPGVPVCVWSDWHFGETVKAIEVGGANDFNLTIAEARIRKLVERTIDLCFNHMVNPRYPGIVVCLAGDMISGNIHDELRETNEEPVAPTLVRLQGLLIWAIDEIAKRFGRVFIPCVVGNHGRMTKKPQAKSRVHESFEWILYCQIERHFAGDARVRFLIPGESDAHFSVAGHRFMLTHGDALGVRGGDGIIGLLGPVARGTIKTRTSEAQIGRDFDTLLMGHWHQYLTLPGCIVNGTLKGYDEFARLFLRARFQEPIQALFFVNPKRGVTYQIPVILEDKPARSKPEFVEWSTAA